VYCIWYAWFVVGLVTSLSASFTRWRANNDNKEKRVHNSSIVSNQSLISASSDVLTSTLLSSDVQNTGCESSLRPEIAATPKMIRKRRADNDTQPFSTTKKLVLYTALELLRCKTTV